jgi:DeoR family fructose operon transcriptional repressor
MSKLQIARTLGLCELLDTSDATVHRDVEWLEQEGFLERIHGGMILNQHLTFELEYIQRAQKTDC